MYTSNRRSTEQAIQQPNPRSIEVPGHGDVLGTDVFISHSNVFYLCTCRLKPVFDLLCLGSELTRLSPADRVGALAAVGRVKANMT